MKEKEDSLAAFEKVEPSLPTNFWRLKIGLPKRKVSWSLFATIFLHLSLLVLDLGSVSLQGENIPRSRKELYSKLFPRKSWAGGLGRNASTIIRYKIDLSTTCQDILKNTSVCLKTPMKKMGVVIFQLNTCPRTKKCQPKSGLVPEDLGVPVWQGHAWRVLSGESDSRIGGTGGENHPKTMAYCKRLEKMPSFWHDWYKLIYIYIYVYVCTYIYICTQVSMYMYI